MAKKKKGSPRAIPQSTLKNNSFHIKESWLNILALLLITIIFIGVYYYSFDEKVNLNGDNASYYLLGKGIVNGEGYVLYNDLLSKPHSHFPPGYPLIIAFIMLFSKSTFIIKLANGAFLLASCFLLYSILKKCKIQLSVILVSIIFLLFNYHIVNSSVTMMSEVPFLFFSLLSLFLLMQIQFIGEYWKTRTFWFFILSLGFTFHIRTVGIALVVGILFYLLLEKRFKAVAVVTVSFILTLIPWMLRNKIQGLGGNYREQLLKINTYRPELGDAGFADFITRIGKNLYRYTSKEIPSAMVPFREVHYKTDSLPMDWGIGIIAIALILFGIYKLPRYRTLFFGYIAGTFPILMLWPDVWNSPRFLLPLIPLMIFLAIYALTNLMNTLLAYVKLNSWVTPIFLLPFLTYYIQDFVPTRDINRQSYPITRLKVQADNGRMAKWNNYFKIAEYCKKNLKESDIIACRKPQLFHIYADRFTTFYPFEADDKKLINNLKKKDAHYVVVDQLGFSSTGKYLVPAINKNKQYFKQVLHLKNPDTYLFEFRAPK